MQSSRCLPAIVCPQPSWRVGLFYRRAAASFLARRPHASSYRCLIWRERLSFSSYRSLSSGAMAFLLLHCCLFYGAMASLFAISQPLFWCDGFSSSCRFRCLSFGAITSPVVLLQPLCAATTTLNFLPQPPSFCDEVFLMLR